MGRELRDNAQKLIALLALLCAVVILGVTDTLSRSEVYGLMAATAGYIFGRYRWHNGKGRE